MTKTSTAAYQWYHSTFDSLDFKTLYSASNRAKKHGYNKVGQFIKAVADHNYARMKGGASEAIKHLDQILDFVEEAYYETLPNNQVEHANIMNVVLKRV